MATTTPLTAAERPYSPSWADVLAERLARLGARGWLLYVVTGVAIFTALTLVQWRAGTYPVGTIRLAHLAIAAAIPGYLWLIGRFNVVARDAFRGLGPSLRVKADEARILEYRLTTLPGAQVIGVALVFLAGNAIRFALIPEVLANIGISRSGWSLVISIPIFVAISFVAAAFVMKIAAQTWLIHRILTRHVDIDLFDVSPLYAFSWFAARIVISLYVAGAIVILVEPRTFLDPAGLASAIVGALLGIVVFVLPFAGVHGRLVAEKERHLVETSRRIEQVRVELHQAVGSRDLHALSPLNDAMTGLETERRLLERIPTWPWQPETLRWVVGALMFPVVLFVLQLLIGRLAG